jgi:hypothetical protein
VINPSASPEWARVFLAAPEKVIVDVVAQAPGDHYPLSTETHKISYSKRPSVTRVVHVRQVQL